jgi:hypothetical protein
MEATINANLQSSPQTPCAASDPPPPRPSNADTSESWQNDDASSTRELVDIAQRVVKAMSVAVSTIRSDVSAGDLDNGTSNPNTPREASTHNTDIISTLSVTGVPLSTRAKESISSWVGQLDDAKSGAVASPGKRSVATLRAHFQQQRLARAAKLVDSKEFKDARELLSAVLNSESSSSDPDLNSGACTLFAETFNDGPYGDFLRRGSGAAIAEIPTASRSIIFVLILKGRVAKAEEFVATKRWHDVFEMLPQELYRTRPVPLSCEEASVTSELIWKSKKCVATALAHTRISSVEAKMLFGELASSEAVTAEERPLYLDWLATSLLEMSHCRANRRSILDHAGFCALQAYEMGAQMRGDEAVETQRSILLLALIHHEKESLEAEVWVDYLRPSRLPTIDAIPLTSRGCREALSRLWLHILKTRFIPNLPSQLNFKERHRGSPWYCVESSLSERREFSIFAHTDHLNHTSYGCSPLSYLASSAPRSPEWGCIWSNPSFIDTVTPSQVLGRCESTCADNKSHSHSPLWLGILANNTAFLEACHNLDWKPDPKLKQIIAFEILSAFNILVLLKSVKSHSDAINQAVALSTPKVLMANVLYWVEHAATDSNHQDQNTLAPFIEGAVSVVTPPANIKVVPPRGSKPLPLLFCLLRIWTVDVRPAMRVLLQHGADINKPLGSKKVTALHWILGEAVAKAREVPMSTDKRRFRSPEAPILVDYIHFLVQNGADIQARDATEKRPVDIAFEMGFYFISRTRETYKLLGSESTPDFAAKGNVLCLASPVQLQ